MMSSQLVHNAKFNSSPSKLGPHPPINSHHNDEAKPLPHRSAPASNPQRRHLDGDSEEVNRMHSLRRESNVSSKESVHLNHHDFEEFESSSSSIFSSVMYNDEGSSADSGIGSFQNHGASHSSLLSSFELSYHRGQKHESSDLHSSQQAHYSERNSFSDDSGDGLDDETARLTAMASLMKDHSDFVTTSLIERTRLVQSVDWLSRHVPGSVLKRLHDHIVHSRKQKSRGRERRRSCGQGSLQRSANYKKSHSRDGVKRTNRDAKDEHSPSNEYQHSPHGNHNLPPCADDAQTPSEDTTTYTARKSGKGAKVTKSRSESDARFLCDDLHIRCDVKHGQSENRPNFYNATNVSNTNYNVYNNINIDSSPPFVNETILPIAFKHKSALLFVDMSGFTKISTMLDVESLSSAINSYFEMIVNEVTSHGGDILKFAGDAIFAEWKVSRQQKPHHNLEYCVSAAAGCAASIVANCSDFPVFAKTPGKSRNSFQHPSAASTPRSSVRELLRRSQQGESSNSHLFAELRNLRLDGSFSDPLRKSVDRASSLSSLVVADLNVKCGVGAGNLVGVHVGDDVSRREYLILGDPIDQVANAEAAASHGEVFASPKAIEALANTCSIEGDWQTFVCKEQPMRIAARDERFFRSRRTRMMRRKSTMSNEPGTVLLRCDDLENDELKWLKKMVSLYVHPVVVNDDVENFAPLKRESDHERHLAEAELRNVFVMFITPLIEAKITGDAKKDQELFNLLNDIMNLTSRELHRAQGHLRQFIVDDKGVVLICTFGLRGSTFPNMIAQRALPITFAIHKALEEELGVENRVGATFGRAYCGVVGGVRRHEFAVLGPSVNLAARLMASKFNPGILVDRNVRLLTSQIFFKPLPAVKAKGYDDPVPIFEPVRGLDNRWGHTKKDFIGRRKEIKEVMLTAKDMALKGTTSRLLFVTAVSGTGKSALITQAAERIRAMLKKMKKRVIVAHNISNDGDSRVPFSLFRSIFKVILSYARQDEENSQAARRMSRPRLASDSSIEFSIDGQWDNLSLHSISTSSIDSTMSSDATRFRFICKELNAPPEFAEIVGRRLLGIREKNPNAPSTHISSAPTLIKIVDFIADAFIRCTQHVCLVLLALDDVHEMDEMSWKVVQAIFERGKNVLTLCGSRPPSSIPLMVDPDFWSHLHSTHQETGRYSEIYLNPLSETEVQEMIATVLGVQVNDIENSFRRNIFKTSGGMPHFLSYVLETIKRNKLAVKQESGLVGLKDSANDEHKLEFESVGELLLFRLDALDSSVRTALHLSAVLGTEFDLIDATLAYEEMFGVEECERLETAKALCTSLCAAVEEGIIEESFTGGIEDDCEGITEGDKGSRGVLGNVSVSLTGRKAHPLYAENRRYRFSHDSWKTSILNVMLDQRKRDMHYHVAMALEREQGEKSHDPDDFEKQIRIFKHWKFSGNFTRAADSALQIGSQLMILGLNSQSILLFNDTLDIWKENDCQSVESHGGIHSAYLDSMDVPELERLIKLNIAKGKAYSTIGNSKCSAEAYQDALDILHNTASASDEKFDRSVSFPIFSGLFVVLKMGAIQQDSKCSYEKDLCKKFVEQARLNGDPVHYCRALAMQGETLGRLGNFRQAFEPLEQIKQIYDIETHHSAICKAYGSDRVAQAFSHSVNWHRALGNMEAALETCIYIIEKLVPKSDKKNVHGSVCLLYAPIMTMKDNGQALRAREVFLANVVEPFERYFGPGGKTFALPLFKPILMLLDLQGNLGGNIENIDEYTEWALDINNLSIKSESVENAWASISVSPSTISSEICFYLSMRQNNVDVRNSLITNGLSLGEKSVTSTVGLPFAHMYAVEKLTSMEIFAKECNYYFS